MASSLSPSTVDIPVVSFYLRCSVDPLVWLQDGRGVRVELVIRAVLWRPLLAGIGVHVILYRESALVCSLSSS